MTDISITDYAWAAGIIDGEGCILIHKSKPTKGAKNSTYSGRIRVTMTHLDTIKRLHTILGGNVYSRNKQNDKYKNQFAWEINSIKCKEIIPLIINFLFTKKEEAKVLCEFFELPKATSFKETPSWLLIERERLYLKIKELKGYNFTESISIVNKYCKKDIKSNCLVCGDEMSAFNENGVKKILCSDECKHRERRVLTDEQEKVLLDNYRSGEYTYTQLAHKFSIKRGTVGWIIKKYASISSISGL